MPVTSPQMASARTQHRSWTMTLYNDEEFEVFKSLSHKYMVAGEETCPTTGRKHYQCYVRLSSPAVFASLKNKLLTAHLEVAKGTDGQNKEYCSKEHCILESGTLSAQGRRNDLDRVRNLVDSGASMLAVAKEVTSRRVWVWGSRHGCVCGRAGGGWQEQLDVLLQNKCGCCMTAIADLHATHGWPLHGVSRRDGTPA
eukprot:365148-Chlamydomonas_euryale.AAC.6